MAKQKYYMLRTCNPDMTAHGGFKWPENGKVVCPDWSDEAWCGNGLHGLLNGEGDGSLLSWDKDAKWLVVEIDKYVDLGRKVKAPYGKVVHCGDRKSATDAIIRLCPTAKAVVGAFVTSGNGGTSTSGCGGTSTSGNRGTSTSGYGGTSTSGDCGIIVCRWHDGKRYRLSVGYVGECGIEPGVAYKVDEKGKFYRADAQKEKK